MSKKPGVAYKFKMKYLLFVTGMLYASVCFSQKPQSIIFDTDIAPDYDDVGALTMLHAFADKGKVRILATISSNAFETTVPTLSVLNTYFGKPGIPIGVTRSANPNKACGQHWAEEIIQKYPHGISTNEAAWDAVALYRKILSEQPDSSVTIISVGFFTNLANLLDSGPDRYSGKNGKALVSQKVKRLVSMAGKIGADSTGGYEFNVATDPAASKKVYDQWPTPIVLSGFEIGEQILTGIKLIHNNSIHNSPVQDAFRIALTRDGNKLGRNSWDETAVLAAVLGPEPYFSTRMLNFDIMPDGKNVLIPGKRFACLTLARPPAEIAAVIEELMMHQPANKE